MLSSVHYVFLLLFHRGRPFLPSPPPSPQGNGQINAEFYRDLTGNREFSVESYCARGEVLRLKMVGEILVWRAARTEVDVVTLGSAC